MDINEEHNDREELEKMAPTLFGLKKDRLGNVPDGYFDELPQRMQEAISSKENTKWQWSNMFKTKRNISYALTTLALVFGIYWVVDNQNQFNRNNNDLVHHEFIELENMTVSDIIDELSGFSIESEEISLLDTTANNNFLATLDHDYYFDDFYNSIDEEPSSNYDDEFYLEELESYFGSFELEFNEEIKLN